MQHHTFYLHFHIIAIFILAISKSCMPEAALLHQAGASNASVSFKTGEDNSFWISESGNYTFGFQNVSNTEYLLSIWHLKDPNQTAIWWPILSNNVSSGSDETQNVPATVNHGGFFNYTVSGSLELYNYNSSIPIWSTKTNSRYAELEDTGNLRLLNSNKSETIWQSFNDLRDCLILASVDNKSLKNKSRLLQSRANSSTYAPGKFFLTTDENLYIRFHSTDAYNNDFVYLILHIITLNEQFTVQDESTGNVYNLPQGMDQTSRVTLDPDGNMRFYVWTSGQNSWQYEIEILNDRCKLGSPCGPFGICMGVNDNSIPNCTCPYGYHAKSTSNLALGCVANVTFNANCSNLDASQYNITMAVIQKADFYYNDIQSQTGIQQSDCANLCLQNCSCIGATYTGTCYLKGNTKTGYLMNGITSNNTALLKIAIRATQPGRSNGIASLTKILPAVVVPIFCIFIAFIVWYICKRKNNLAHRSIKQQTQWEIGSDDLVRAHTLPLSFKYDELEEATEGFNEPLGEGGFGKVYKGWLKKESIVELIASNLYGLHQASDSVGIPIAVKVLKDARSKMSKERDKQFLAEVNTLGKIHHVNLVKLLGYCSINYADKIKGEQISTSSHKSSHVDSTKKMLIYEYLEKGSLDMYLKPGTGPLPWSVRFGVALGTARGIAYLHHDCSPPILHCDIKPQNVLLDHNFIAKVADFGFARHFQEQNLQNQSNVSQQNNQEVFLAMSAMRGTPGYMAPEWIKTNKITTKVDVFSYGKLLLDLVHGIKRPCYSERDGVETEVTLKYWALQCVSAGAILSSCSYTSTSHDSVVSDNDNESIHSGAYPLSRSYAEGEVSHMIQVLKVALWCVHDSPLERPSMSQVVQILESMNQQRSDSPLMFS